MRTTTVEALPNVNETDVPRAEYTFAEAQAAATDYFKGDELAATVWVSKYALKDSQGRIFERTPDEMHRRLAVEFARIEQRYANPMSEEEIYDLLRDFRYIIPQGSPMAGIGNPYQISSLSNCFVIGSGVDSYGGIIRTDEEQVQLMKRRGGVGHDLSHIRPKGSPVLNSALTSSGLVPFMERYSNSTREVAQDGRRGALMLTISIKHPDAEDFINAKLEQGKVTGANVSVRIDDAFMHAAINGKPYRQQFPIHSDNPRVVKDLDAAKLWDKIIYNAWKSAEPGVLFWDTVIRESVPDCYADLGYQTISTNPCGEIPLCPYDSCRLIAINLFSYVEYPFLPNAYFNFEKFEKHVRAAQRMMDDLIDLEIEKIERILIKIETDPEPTEIKEVEYQLWQKVLKTCREGRRTGLGITAEGDMLAALRLQYGSEEAIEFAVKVQRTLAVSAYRSSVEMARERGAFLIYNTEREAANPFVNRLREADPGLYEEMAAHGRRNLALLTIAPTGTTSLMTQTTSGIEPVFLISYLRRRKVNPSDKDARVTFVDEVGDSWEEYRVFHHKFADWLQALGYDVEKVKTLPADEIQPIIESSPYFKATANDIDWVQKVKMQGAIQKWVDHSISVTVNVPEHTTVDMVKRIYQTAWEHGCKGCTIYRDGSRSGVLVSESKSDKKAAENGQAHSENGSSNGLLFRETLTPKRPPILEAELVRFKNNNEHWLAVIGLYENRPYEIFTGRAEDTFRLPDYVNRGWVIKTREENGANRYDFRFQDKEGYKVTIEGLSRSFDKEYWNYAKLISGVLRLGMPIHKVVNLIDGLNVEDTHINTWKNGVLRALKRHIPDGTKMDKQACPNCNDTEHLVYREGCLTCENCGYSKCG